MFKIGEFSKLTQVSIRMLRYYDEAGLLHPKHVDTLSGYRYYDSDQIPLLQKIVLLRDMDFHTAQIKDVLNSWEEDAVIDRLKTKRGELLSQKEELERRIYKVDAAIQDIEKQELAVHYNIVVKKVPAAWIVSLRKVIPTYFHEGMLWRELNRMLEEKKIDVMTDGVTIFHDEGYQEQDVDEEVGCYVKDRIDYDISPLSCRLLEEVTHMACIMVYGSYANISAAYCAFGEWNAAHQQYQMYGCSRQIVHVGEMSGAKEEDFLTEIQIPVKFIPHSI